MGPPQGRFRPVAVLLVRLWPVGACVWLRPGQELSNLLDQSNRSLIPGGCAASPSRDDTQSRADDVVKEVEHAVLGSSLSAHHLNVHLTVD
jgi:hypothetical protein